MTKKELLLELNLLHSKIISLQDEAVDAWREAEPMSEDEEFFKETGEKLEDLESDLSSFITSSAEDLSISAEPITIEELEELDLDEEFDEASEQETHEEMNEDPEGYPKKEYGKRAFSAIVRSYCIQNNLFTSGDSDQYAKTLEAADVDNNYHDVAVMVWICSETNKTINQIENDLRRMDE